MSNILNSQSWSNTPIYRAPISNSSMNFCATRSQQSQALKVTWLSITFVYQVHKCSFCITIKELLWGISVSFAHYQTLARKLGCRLLQVQYESVKILTGSYLLFLSHYLRRLRHNIHLPSCLTVPFHSALMMLVACVTHVSSFLQMLPLFFLSCFLCPVYPLLYHNIPWTAGDFIVCKYVLKTLFHLITQFIRSQPFSLQCRATSVYLYLSFPIDLPRMTHSAFANETHSILSSFVWVRLSPR